MSSESETAIEDLFDRHASAVFRLGYALLRDADDAQDVVQETFVVAWRKRRSITLVDGSPLPWLLATARRISLAHRRRVLSRRTEAVESSELDRMHGAAVASDDASSIREALEGLPHDDRRVIELVLVEGWSYAEAADALGLTVAAAGKRLQRAKSRLRAELDGNDPAPRRRESRRAEPNNSTGAL